METLLHNSILVPPLFLFPKQMGLVVYFKPHEMTFRERGTKSEGLKFSRDLAAAGLESYSRQMVSQFSLEVQVPYIKLSPVKNAAAIKNRISPSLRKRLKIIDRRNNYWDAIKRYFEPIRRDISEDINEFSNSIPLKKLFLLTWLVYMIVLGSKKGADVAVDPNHNKDLCDALLTFPKLSSESKSRLSVVRGIFAAYRDSELVPSLMYVPSITVGRVAERIDEILDDAYMIEASNLRRFFGLRQNIASVRRDLRSLTRFIVKNRPWAKGLTNVVSQRSFFGSDAVIEGLNALCESKPNSAPVCFDPIQHIKSLGVPAGEMLWTNWPVHNGTRAAWWSPQNGKWM
ncbi:hypothetical protein [Desulfosarcina ovata]|nr:hypothetical protein [Desulfosarcina ovata]